MAKQKDVEKAVAETPQSDSTEAQKGVLAAVGGIMLDLAKAGLGKNQYNEGQKFNFRGIDDILNLFSTTLVNRRVIVRPKFTDRLMSEFTTKTGGRGLSVSLAASYQLVSLDDGSALEFGPFYGEGADYGDKATYKAMSGAFKYFVIQSFVLPLVGNDDPDFGNPEGVGKGVASTQQSAENPVQAAIKRLAPTNANARKVLTGLVTKAYSVEAVEQVPADKQAEAIKKLETYVAKQAERNAKKAA